MRVAAVRILALVLRDLSIRPGADRANPADPVSVLVDLDAGYAAARELAGVGETDDPLDSGHGSPLLIGQEPGLLCAPFALGAGRAISSQPGTSASYACAS